MKNDLLNQVKARLLTNRENYASQYLRKAKSTLQGQVTYICPFCGKGGNGEGIKFHTDLYLTCFNKNCNGGSKDLIHYIGKELDLNFSETIRRLANDLGIEKSIDKSELKEVRDANIDNAVVKIQEPNNMNQVKEYFANRNISGETITKLVSRGKIGFAPWGGNNPYIWFIIKSDEAHLRNFDKNFFHYSKDDNKKKTFVWLSENLTNDNEYIFITEGEIDCLSLLEKGFNALSIGSSTSAEKLIDFIPEDNFNKKLIIVFDNDKSGNGARESLAKELRNKRPNVEFIQYFVDDFYNDVNDYFMAVPGDDFVSWGKYAIDNFANIKAKALLNQLKEYDLKEDSTISRHIENMFKSNNGVHLVGQEFNHLNKVINGFKDGLTLIGGMPGSGKTSFATQLMLDFASQSQNICLIISLEMSASELLPRMLANTSFNSYIKGEDIGLIQASGFVKNDENKNYIEQATNKIKDKMLSKIANNILLIDGLEFDFNKIEKLIEDFSLIEPNKKHIVMLDYLQFIQLPHDMSFHSIREEVKYTTDKLNIMAKKYEIPLFLLSSLNRDSYNRKPCLKDFKESGAVEFTAMHAIILTKGKYVGCNENGVFYDIIGKRTLKELKDEKSKKYKVDIPICEDDKLSIDYCISEWWVVKNRTGESNKNQTMAFYGAFNSLEEVFQGNKVFDSIKDEIENQINQEEELKQAKKNAKKNSKNDEELKLDEENKFKSTKEKRNNFVVGLDI